jgi:hypothetical protein
VPLPHHQTGQDKDREEDVSNSRSVIRDLIERAINVTDYWDREHDVKPAKDRTLGGVAYHPFLRRERIRLSTDSSAIDLEKECKVLNTGPSTGGEI